MPLLLPGTRGAAMAIQQLQIHGFRSLRDVTWQPGPLNLLVGPNGGGKSNVLRCLELISAAAKGQLESAVAADGGIAAILWDNRAKELGWSLRIDPVHKPSDRVTDAPTYVLRLAQSRGGSGYHVKEESLGNWHRSKRERASSPHIVFQRDSMGQVESRSQAIALSMQADELQFNESLLSQCAIAIPASNTARGVRRGLSNWRIYQDVSAAADSPMRKPATTQFTKRLAVDGSNLVTVLHTLYTGDREFQELIDAGMRAGFGSEYKELVFQPAAAQQIQLAVQWKSSSQPHAGADLSDGTLRFLFLLTLLAHPEPGAVVAVDEPEVGLHPSMLPVIAEYAAAASERTQVILTSHSPEFLDAFSDLAPQVTLCHWEQGETKLYTLAPESLAKWLEVYRLGHLFTRGDLDAFAMPGVEPLEDADKRFADFPSEDEAMADLDDAQ